MDFGILVAFWGLLAVGTLALRRFVFCGRWINSPYSFLTFLSLAHQGPQTSGLGIRLFQVTGRETAPLGSIGSPVTRWTRRNRQSQAGPTMPRPAEPFPDGVFYGSLSGEVDVVEITVTD